MNMQKNSAFDTTKWFVYGFKGEKMFSRFVTKQWVPSILKLRRRLGWQVFWRSVR